MRTPWKTLNRRLHLDQTEVHDAILWMEKLVPIYLFHFLIHPPL